METNMSLRLPAVLTGSTDGTMLLGELERTS